MSFFKRFTRSRSNSYNEDDYEPNSSPQEPRTYDPNRPPSSWRFDHPDQQQQPLQQSPRISNSDSHNGIPDPKMYQSHQSPQQPQSMQQQLPYHNSSQRSSAAAGMMTNRSSRDGFVDVPNMNAPTMGSQQMPASMSGGGGSMSGSNPMQKMEALAAPDSLARAFHEAVRPYSEKIEGLEQQIRDLEAFVDQLEAQRVDIYAWIDKRGLRPDVPPTIAKQMDSQPGAAEALNGQLDRKITIVNFDLHRLQDDLNDSISSAHFASSMLKFLPDIQRLASLQTGPKYAYDLIIKLVGNLNSHGGVEANRDVAGDAEIQEDRRARQDFYERMDDELIDVVRKRNQEGENWDVQKEIRRFERNAAFLKNLGIDTYFPHALEVMKQEAGNPHSAGMHPSSGPTGPSYGNQTQAQGRRSSPPGYGMKQ